jgi:hypothetical protein
MRCKSCDRQLDILDEVIGHCFCGAEIFDTVEKEV